MEEEKQQFKLLVDGVRASVKQFKKLEPRPVDHNWLRSPEAKDVEKLTKALEYLEPKFAELKALASKKSRRVVRAPGLS